MFAFIRSKSIGVPGRINTRQEDKSKASLFLLNANSLETELTEQRGSSQGYVQSKYSPYDPTLTAPSWSVHIKSIWAPVYAAVHSSHKAKDPFFRDRKKQQQLGFYPVFIIQNIRCLDLWFNGKDDALEKQADARNITNQLVCEGCITEKTSCTFCVQSCYCVYITVDLQINFCLHVFHAVSCWIKMPE